MNIALWVIQALLAFMFLYAGGMKTFAYDKYRKMTAKEGEAGLSYGMAKFIGISELAGGVGVILPMASGVAPVLTPIAAGALGVVMILAAGYHLRRKEAATMPIVLLILCIAVAVGRGMYV